MVATDYGYLKNVFTVVWLIIYTVGLPVQIFEAYRFEAVSQVIFVAFILYIVSSYTSSIVAVVCISIIKRRKFLETIENISEVDNKIRYTHQEETYMNRNVMFNIISEIILLTVQCMLIMYVICPFRGEEYYSINLTLTVFVLLIYVLY